MIDLREIDAIEIGMLTFDYTKDQFIITGLYELGKTITIAHPRYMMSLGGDPVEFELGTIANSERWTIVDQPTVGFPVYDPSDKYAEPRFIDNHQEAKENEVAMPLWCIKETLADAPVFNNSKTSLLMTPVMENLYLSRKMVEATLAVLSKADL